MLGGRYYPMGVFTPVYPILVEEFYENKPIVPIPCKQVTCCFVWKHTFRQTKMVMRIPESTVSSGLWEFRLKSEFRFFFS